MTGLRAWVRGSSLTNASRTAGQTRLASNRVSGVRDVATEGSVFAWDIVDSESLDSYFVYSCRCSTTGPRARAGT